MPPLIAHDEMFLLGSVLLIVGATTYLVGPPTPVSYIWTGLILLAIPYVHAYFNDDSNSDDD